MSGSVAAQTHEERQIRRPEVLFFDSNESMLDLGGMKPQVTEAFGGRDDLMSLWFSKMLLYSLVDTVTSNYHGFGPIGAACMQMTAEEHGGSCRSIVGYAEVSRELFLPGCQALQNCRGEKK
jgi:2-haloacid dehalogenase